MRHVLQFIWSRLPRRFLERLLPLTQTTYTLGVSGAVFDSGGRILMLKHRFRFNQDWQLPGGFVRGGEDFEAALRREMHEETGFILGDLRLVRVHIARHRHVDILFVAPITGGTMRLDSTEILDGHFFALDELSPPFRRELQSLLEAWPARKDA